MTSIRTIAQELRPLLTTVADDLARQTGLIQRRRVFAGSTLLQTLIFGWLEHPDASLSQLATMAARLGVPVSPQALDQRFTPALVSCLDALFDHLRADAVSAPPVAIPLLRRFSPVYLLDSTSITVPDDWAERWPGSGGSHGSGQATLKVSTLLDLLSGRLLGPLRLAGRVHDNRAPHATQPLPAGSLRISDRGYFDLATLRTFDRLGSYWLLRPKAGTLLELDGQRLKVGVVLADWLTRQSRCPLDRPIRLGGQQRLPARLVAEPATAAQREQRLKRLAEQAHKHGQPVSADQRRLAGWNLWVTNLPGELATPDEVAVLARARWQIEWLFRFWKEHLGLDRSRSAQPVRIMAECYAKLLGAVLMHWLVVASCWAEPERSLVKVARQLRPALAELAVRLNQRRGLLSYLTRMCHTVGRHCTISKRRSRPSTAQQLLNPSVRGP